MKVFFDGGWRPATGMELAVVIGGRSVVRRDLGPGSAMAAEWLALIEALRLSESLEAAVLLGDAAAVIAQAKGEVRCPAAFVAYRDEARELMRPGTRLRYVKRGQNLAGVALASAWPR